MHMQGAIAHKINMFGGKLLCRVLSQKGALFERRLRLLGQSLLLTLIHAMSRGKNVGWGKFLEHSLCIFGGKFEKFANYRRRSPLVSPYRTLCRNYFKIIQQKISKTS